LYHVNFKEDTRQQSRQSDPPMLVRQQQLQNQADRFERERKKQKRKSDIMTGVSIASALAIIAMAIISISGMRAQSKATRGSGEKSGVKKFIEQFVDLKNNKKIVSIENDSIDSSFRKFASKVKASADAPKEVLEFIGDEATDNMIILSGRSGYGKTYSADVLFKELGAKRIKRQFSNWSSKYVGETATNVTEFFNNLEKVLKENPGQRFGLVLDEADSLFTPLEMISGDHAHLKETRSAILNGLDQIRKYPNFFMVATTNAEVGAGQLDEAIVRRFAHNYEIKAPNPKALLASLKTQFSGYKGIESLFKDSDLMKFLTELNQKGAGHGDIENISISAKTKWKAKMMEMGKAAGLIDKTTGEVLNKEAFNKLMTENPVTSADLREALQDMGKLAIETRKPPKSMMPEIPNQLAVAIEEATRGVPEEEKQNIWFKILEFLKGQNIK